MTGLIRDNLEKYFTKESTVRVCINALKKYLNIENTDLIIEPSAGKGAFIKDLKELSNNYLFYDISPENEEIFKQDFLKLEVSNLRFFERIHIIGNPPFGRQSTLAKKFIKKSCEFGETVSFILPKSFKKESFKKTFPLDFWLKVEIDLPDNSFTVNGVSHDVPCVFQIWEKRNTQRKLPIKLEPKDFKFVKINEKPDVSFRRVGVNAGTISTNTEKSESSHYFIKFDNFNETILNKIKGVTFLNDNTVGPKSISKPEIIEEFNKVI